MPYYRWKTGKPQPKIEAEVFGLVLEQIDRDFGNIKPRMVVDVARDPTSALHPVFDWDNESASEKWRRHHARQLIGSLVTISVNVEHAHPLEVRGFFSVQETPNSARAYLPTAKIMTNRDLKAMLLGDAAKELDSFLVKFAGIIAVGSPAVTHVHEAIDSIRDEIARLEQQAARRAA